jgi:Rod binding domain-containing protein
MSDLHLHPVSQAGATTPSSNSPSPKLVSAAHEFEAAMMKELMAPLQPGHDSLEGGEDEAGSSSALSSFASEALGKALSEHGGLGIAKSILHQLTARGNHSGNPSVPANLNGTNTKSSSK